jgi:hypothetical protein
VKITSLSTIGIEQDDKYLKGVTLFCKNKKLTLQKFQQPIDFINVKLFYMSSTVCITSLNTSDVLQKKIQIPKVFNQDIDSSIGFQIESSLLYPLDEAVFERQKTKKEKKFHHFSTYIVKKSLLKNHLESLKNTSIKPQIVTTKPHALYELTSFIENFEGLLVHVDQNGTTLVFKKDNQLAFYAHSDINTSSFDKGGHALLCKVIEWKKELMYLIHVFEEEFGPIEKNIVAIGSLFKSVDFLSLINKNFIYQFVCPEIKNLNISLQDFMDYAHPLGLALSGLPKNSNDINFIKDKASLGYLKKPFFIYYSTALVLSLLILFFNFYFYNNFKEHLLEKGNQLLLLKEREVKIPLKDVENEDNLQNVLQKIDANDRVFAYPYSLTPNSATITEVFAWLSSLKLPKGIQIENIHYYLEKYPNCKNPKNPYITKCEIEFRSENEQTLLQLQEKLMDDKKMIVQGKDFKFTLKGHLAKVSFILKPVKK